MSLIISPYLFAPTGPTDPNFADVVSLLHFDGTDGSTTFTDEKGRTWAASGDAQLDTSITKFGSAALLLDGTGDYIADSGPNSDWEFLHSGADDFTLEMWLYPSSITTYHPVCMTADASASLGSSLYVDSGGIVGFDVCKGAGGGVYAARLASAASAISTGVWTHVAVVYEQAGGAADKLRLYIGGVKIDADDLATPSSGAPTFPMNIGRSVNFGGFYFNGSIDDFRVTNGVARYTSNFTPPSAPFPDS